MTGFYLHYTKYYLCQSLFQVVGASMVGGGEGSVNNNYPKNLCISCAFLLLHSGGDAPWVYEKLAKDGVTWESDDKHPSSTSTSTECPHTLSGWGKDISCPGNIYILFNLIVPCHGELKLGMQRH